MKMKQKSKKWPIFLAFMLISILMAACSSNDIKNDAEEKVITVTDMLGRKVEIPQDADQFVNVGVGALRLYTYVAPLDQLVGIERKETEGQTGVPYSVMNQSIFESLPIIGQGGPTGTADPEQILTVAPDVIFNTYAMDAASADELQEKTGIPVVVLSYGENGGIFNQEILDSLRLIGTITGEEEHAEEVIATLKEYEADLTARTSQIKKEDKPTVYIGALGNKGPQGIESTQGDYSLTNILQVNNVADQTGKKGSLMIDKEQLLTWDPEYIFIDLDGYQIVQKDYEKNTAFYQSLTAFKNDHVHVQLPFILLRTNVETAIADAYYMGTVLYPQEFKDIDPEKKADEIYTKLLGKPFYEQMVQDYTGFGKFKIEE